MIRAGFGPVRWASVCAGGCTILLGVLAVIGWVSAGPVAGFVFTGMIALVVGAWVQVWWTTVHRWVAVDGGRLWVHQRRWTGPVMLADAAVVMVGRGRRGPGLFIVNDSTGTRLPLRRLVRDADPDIIGRSGGQRTVVLWSSDFDREQLLTLIAPTILSPTATVVVPEPLRREIIDMVSR